MEIDLVKLNKLWRFVADAEQSLITTAELLHTLKENLEELRRIELALLERPDDGIEQA